MNTMSLKDISIAGLIAAIYAVMALAFAPISFGVYQVRVSEALTVLPFLTPAAIPGLFFGCMIANVLGGLGWLDIVFGSLITLAAAFATRGVYHLSRSSFSYLIAWLTPLVLWGGALYTLVYDVNGLVAIVPSLVSIGCLFWAEGNRAESRSRASWVALLLISAILMLLALSVFVSEFSRMFILGATVMVAAWFITWGMAYLWARGKNLNTILAPLPPVLFNAFGVSLYLAPIMGVPYFFSVQMVGIGQLIACYLLGLPVLLILERRARAIFG